LQDRVVFVAEMLTLLAPLVSEGDAVVDPDRGPARYVHARHDATKRIGFISGTSDTFCAGCDRLRVASNGTLRPCLATNDGLSGADEANEGDARAVAAAVREVWKQKPDGQTWKGCTEESARDVSIRSIGG
jgi:GTP 3',8-cyclase